MQHSIGEIKIGPATPAWSQRPHPSRSALFYFTLNVLFVSQVECRNLGFVWVCTQIIGSVVLCKSAQRFFNSCFHFYETGLLSCDTQIVCVYEAPCSVVERLVVSVDVE